jgi:hypothetical protein
MSTKFSLAGEFQNLVLALSALVTISVLLNFSVDLPAPSPLTLLEVFWLMVRYYL